MAKKKPKPVVKKQTSNLLGAGKIKTKVGAFTSRKNFVPIASQPKGKPIAKYVDRVRVDKKKLLTDLKKKAKNKPLNKKEQKLLEKLSPAPKPSVARVVKPVVKKVITKAKPSTKVVKSKPLPSIEVQAERTVVYDSVLFAEANPTASQDEVKGHELFVLADQEGMLIRDVVKWPDLLVKIELTPETCTPNIRSYAAAFTTQADNDLRERVKHFNQGQE